MKIAYISTAEYPAPTPKNAIQAALWICGKVAEGMTAKGHETIYIGAGDSSLRVTRNVNTMPAFYEQYDYETLIKADRMVKSKLQMTYQMNLHLQLINFLHQESVDLIHFHTSPPFFSLPFAKEISIPKLFTFHDPLLPQYIPTFDLFKSETNHYVTISNTQRKDVPNIEYRATVYNGVDIENFPFHDQAEDYTVFVGRITPSKGVDKAIQVARKTDNKLFILGGFDLAFNDWLNTDIKPFVDGEQIQALGHVERTETHKQVGRAKVFISPIQWDEPFGLVSVESMACGTPVISYARGAAPEVIKDGETGFLVNPSADDNRGDYIIKKTGIEGMCEAVERIYSMSPSEYIQMRRKCREQVEQKFTLQRMIDQYEEVYHQILAA